MQTGGCSCAGIRFEFETAVVLSAHHCFCKDCQRATGSGFATVILIPSTALVVKTGKAKFFATTGKNRAQVKRGFCPNCGSQLYSYLTANPDLVSVKAGSLDESDWVQVNSSTWASSAQPWAKPDPDVFAFETSPEDFLHTCAPFIENRLLPPETTVD
jgi:hypothetical protein